MPEKPILTTHDIQRPPQRLCAALQQVGAATCAGFLGHMGIRNPTLQGPVSFKPGKCVAGPALTLQMIPKREDVHASGEYVGPERQLHRQVLYHTQPGDVVVVDARGDMMSGIFGEMMMTYFCGKGGAGVVVDGCVRDWPDAQHLDLGFWLRGVTPNYHVQTNIFPHAVNVPIACGGVYVAPGDIIVADDDGVVVVPAGMAEELVSKAGEKHDWEGFTRLRLSEGGELSRYYPLDDDAKLEYEAWKKEHGK